ncbi:MAG: 8-oxo-dGTP diphosphatase MutT [Pseudomonadota bacterium]
MDTSPVIRVVAGILERQHFVLIAQRPDGKHGAGLWEFPGGKIESGESPDQALQRELVEELGIDIRASQPFLEIAHDYEKHSVRLYFLMVSRWEGEPASMEGQTIKWARRDTLQSYEFLPANTPVIDALLSP